jgi:hypothetical protein
LYRPGALAGAEVRRQCCGFVTFYAAARPPSSRQRPTP